jgi:aminoglycoside phosphotransferase (APT) family kinase protein
LIPFLAKILTWLEVEDAMSQPWSPDIDVSESLARRLLEAQFPELMPLALRLLGAGFDNSAFLVNDTFVFRFPRRQFAVQFLEAEIQLMPALAARLPLAVPNPVHVGKPTADYPWPFAGYRMIPGQTACTADLTETERTALAGPLAHFLKALHSIPIVDAEAHGAIGDRIARLDLSVRIPRTRELLQKLVEQGTLADSRPYLAILDAAPASFSPRADTVVHGDLYIRHLLVDADRRLTGVIDWGDVHVGDPAVDLAVAHSLLPPGVHAAFREAYGPISSLTWQIARLRALWHTLMVLNYAVATGDEDLIRESRLGLSCITST